MNGPLPHNGPLSQYGTTRTTFTGTLQREDAQPNEGLQGRKRTLKKPPTLKATQPPVFNFPGRAKRGSQSFQGGYQRQQQRKAVDSGWNSRHKHRQLEMADSAGRNASAGPSRAVNARPGSKTWESQSSLTRTHSADPRLGPRPPHKRAKLSHEHDGSQDPQRWGSESTRPSSTGFLPRNGDQDLHSQHYFGQPPNPQTGYGSADTGVSQRRMPQAFQMLSPAATPTPGGPSSATQMSIPPLPSARSSRSPRISFGDDDDIPPLPSLRRLTTPVLHIYPQSHTLFTPPSSAGPEPGSASIIPPLPSRVGQLKTSSVGLRPSLPYNAHPGSPNEASFQGRILSPNTTPMPIYGTQTNAEAYLATTSSEREYRRSILPLPSRPSQEKHPSTGNSSSRFEHPARIRTPSLTTTPSASPYLDPNPNPRATSTSSVDYSRQTRVPHLPTPPLPHSSYNATTTETRHPSPLRTTHPIPLVRVKQEPQDSPQTALVSTATPPPHTQAKVPVKPEPRELSPLEPFIAQRRLVTEGYERFPLPDDCQKRNPNYQQCRRAFHRKKVQFLKGKGLVLSRSALFREDGMVLEWTSPIPVWSDTFESQASDITSMLNAASRANAESIARTRRSMSRSRTSSALRETPPSQHGIPMEYSPQQQQLQHELRPPLPVPPPALIAMEPEVEERPQKIIRPSQVIPPHPHLPKRTFKPVHVPRVVVHEALPPLEDGSEISELGKGRRDSSVTVKETRFPGLEASRGVCDTSRERVKVEEDLHSSIDVLKVVASESGKHDVNAMSVGGGDNEEDSEEDVESEMLDLAEQFLRRYVEMFNHDRTELEMGYSPDALFNVHIHHTNTEQPCMAELFCTKERTNYGLTDVYTGSQIQQGRLRIVNRLRSLGPHKFLGTEWCMETYDLVTRPMSSVCGSPELAILSFHSEAVNYTRAGGSESMGGESVSMKEYNVVTVDQSFVLRKPDYLKDQLDDPAMTMYGSIKGDPWPLIAVSHQMVVREGRMLPQEKVGHLLPWIQNMNSNSG